MSELSRRNFVELSVAMTAAGLLPSGLAREAERVNTDTPVVSLSGDGVDLSPAQFAALLGDLNAKNAIIKDQYGLGGIVQEFESEWARLLGKETALFMPTGTLANHLAVRALAKDRHRVLVQEMSHIYNDTGDSTQILSGLNLIPLAPGKATFARADVERVLERTAGGRVASQVGAIVIESPVRRLAGETFDFDEMKRIAALGRERGIGLHLDGARLFMASAYSSIPVAEYAAVFDTVYISLWKYFNCGVGAILAGPKSLLDGMFHVRRMFGGALWSAWPFAAVARHYMNGFPDRLRSAVRVSEDFFKAVGSQPAFSVERIPNGTTIARLRVRQPDLETVRQRLADRGILLPHPADWGGFTLTVNETWARTTGAELAAAFQRALV